MLRHPGNQQGRIQAYVKPVDPPVEMWAGNATAGADGGNLLSLNNLFSRFDKDAVKMQKAG